MLTVTSRIAAVSPTLSAATTIESQIALRADGATIVRIAASSSRLLHTARSFASLGGVVVGGMPPHRYSRTEVGCVEARKQLGVRFLSKSSTHQVTAIRIRRLGRDLNPAAAQGHVTVFGVPRLVLSANFGNRPKRSPQIDSRSNEEAVQLKNVSASPTGLDNF
jgi:hypothetical protein